jgi:curved DNA-binding protein CbpA
MVKRGERSPDYYEILQVSPYASAEVIHAAYRALARIYHPDVNTSSTTPDLMRRVNFAYETLKDPGRRAAYNLRRARSMRDRRIVAAPPSPALRSRPTQSSVKSRSSGGEPSLGVPGSRARVAVAALIGATVLVIVLVGVWAVLQLSDDSPTLAHFELAVGGVALESAADVDIFDTQPFGRDTHVRSTRSTRP